VWDFAPFDNDLAADWFSELFDETGLAERIAETLELDVAEYGPEIRAAAYVLIQLGHPYVWPAERLDEDLTLAANKLQEILDQPRDQEGAVGDPDLRGAIEREIGTLRSRIRSNAREAGE
jgi:hypothetical protein